MHNRKTSKKVVYSFSNPISNLIHGSTRNCLLKMVETSLHKERPLILELGCGAGQFTRYLPRRGDIVGLEVDKRAVSWAKKQIPHVDFICADICHLPIKKDSVDLAVVASVFEFISDLDCAANEVDTALGKNGVLVTGFPIESLLMRRSIELLDGKSVKTWDPQRVMNKKREIYHQIPTNTSTLNLDGSYQSTS